MYHVCNTVTKKRQIQRENGMTIEDKMQLNLFLGLLKRFHRRRTFKVCPKCRKEWCSMNEFIKDTSLRYNGYQSALDVFEHGLLYFTHSVKGCGSTMSLQADAFSSLYSKDKCSSKETLERDCKNCSLAERKLNRCSQYCERIFSTEISKIMVHHKGIVKKQKPFG